MSPSISGLKIVQEFRISQLQRGLRNRRKASWKNLRYWAIESTKRRDCDNRLAHAPTDIDDIRTYIYSFSFWNVSGDEGPKG